MSKQEFLAQLHRGLSGLPQAEMEERVAFYSEMIDDRVEEGLSEEEAVAVVGTVDDIISGIVADMPLAEIVKKKLESQKRLKAFEIVLLMLGSPVWLSLLIAAFGVALSLYLAVWSVIVSFWAVFGAVVGCAFAGIVGGIAMALGGSRLTGVAVVGTGLVCAGLSIFLFFGCRAATKGVVLLTKMLVLGLKKRLMKKEEA